MQVVEKEPSRRSDAGDYELRDGSATHSQVQIVGTGTVSLDATAPWPELFVPQRPRRLLITTMHNQYRCGAYCTGRPLARRDYQGPRRALGRVTRRTSQAGSFPFVVDSC